MSSKKATSGREQDQLKLIVSPNGSENQPEEPTSGDSDPTPKATRSGKLRLPPELPDDALVELGEERSPRDKRGRVRIPLSGLVTLSSLELRIIDCPSFQRLRRIRQLGGTFIVYPGATHTRFEHSIGAVHVAQQMMDALDRNAAASGKQEPIPKASRKRIRLAALLHDVGHLAYGHTLEDEVRIVGKHDDPKRLNLVLGEDSDIYEVFAEAAELAVLEDVKTILSKDAPNELPPGNVFWADLVANTICADLLDYLRRDFYHLGFACDFDDHILEYLTLADDEDGRRRLAIMLERSGKRRPDAITMILDILGLRYTLAESVLFHHAKDCHSAMLTRAVLESQFLLRLMARQFPGQALQEKYNDRPGSQVSFYFGRGGRKDDQDGEKIEEPQLLDLGDDQLIEMLSVDDDPLCSLLGRMLQRRTLYRLITTIDYAKAGRVRKRGEIIDRTHRFPAKKHALERQMERDLGLPRGSVLFYTPSAKMNAKVAEVHVVAGDTAIPLATYEDRNQNELTGGFLRAQLNRFERLWRSYVFGHPALTSDQIADIKEYVDATFGLQADGDSKEQVVEAQRRGYDRVAEGILKRLNPEIMAGELDKAKATAVKAEHRGKRRELPVRRRLEALAGALERKLK